MPKSRLVPTISRIRSVGITSAALLILAACEQGPWDPHSTTPSEPDDQALLSSAQVSTLGSASVHNSLEYSPTFGNLRTGELEPLTTLSGSGVSLHVEQSWAEETNDLRLRIRVENTTTADIWGLVRIRVTAVHPRSVQVSGYDGEEPVLDLSELLGGGGTLAPGQVSGAGELTISFRGNAVQSARSLRLTLAVEAEELPIEVPTNLTPYTQPWPQEVEVIWWHSGVGIEEFEMQYREPGEEWEDYGTFSHTRFPEPGSPYVGYLYFRGGQTLEIRLRACDAERCSAYTEPAPIVTPPLVLVELRYYEGGVLEPDPDEWYWGDPETQEERYNSWLIDRYEYIFLRAVADDGWEIASYSGPGRVRLSEDRTTLNWDGILWEEGPYVFEVEFARKEP
ncbi:hypothetical protein BH23ACT4_BH23ACT4_08390 [soil metagenome]